MFGHKMDTPSVPSLSDREDSNKAVPKIFFDTHCNEVQEVEKSTSFIQKIMTNARSMLATKCSSLHPSTCSEEPTRETDNCNRYIEIQGKVFKEVTPKTKYTSSDYCMIDEDSSSKQDTTATDILPNELSTGGIAIKDSSGNTSKNSHDITISSYTYTETSNKDTASSVESTQIRDSPFPNLNGPFEPSDFFVALNEKDNSCESTSEKAQKVGRRSSSMVDGWIKPFRNEKNKITKNDLNVPCRDKCYRDGSSSSTVIPIIRHISRDHCAIVPQKPPCYTVNNVHQAEVYPSKDKNVEEDEEGVPVIFPRQQYSSTRELPCYTCGLKRRVVSSPSPSPSVGEELWATNSEKVKTIYCESERYPSKIIVCGDESNVSNACGDNFNTCDDSKPCVTDSCPLKKMNSSMSGKTQYMTPVGTRSGPNKRVLDDKVAEKRKSDHKLDNSPLAKRVRSISDSRDQDNQCAFVGSPILQFSNIKTPSFETKSIEYDGKFGEMISDVNSRERCFHSQIQGLKNRERQYDNMFDSLQGEIEKHHYIHSNDDELERITKELKNENKVLKSEVMEMKLELKHTLERVQGPMRLKLEAEKSRCEQLHGELHKTSQNMAMSQENYIREMNNLKMQLCMACSNMSELENVNKKLKEEMNLMDGMCAKLEDDLMQQKLNEAETIKRLTNRKNMGDIPESIMVYNCESNLHDIARKLSRTIKDSVPCAACSSGIPAELKGAAKLIKDLTDMVESRKDSRSIDSSFSPSRIDISCQSPPITEENSTQCMDFRNIGTGVSMCLVSSTISKPPICAANRREATRTLYAGLKNFVEKQTSSQFNILKSGTDQIDSRYCSAQPLPTSSGCKCPCMKDSQTDPKMVDKQISSGHVHFDEYETSGRSQTPTTRDGLNDPMMADKNVTSEGDKFEDNKLVPFGESFNQIPKNIIYEINTAFVKSSFKSDENKSKDPQPETSRPATSDSKNSKPEIKEIDIDTTCEESVSRIFTPKIKVLKKDYKATEGPYYDQQSGKFLPEALINQGLPLRNKRSKHSDLSPSSSYDQKLPKKQSFGPDQAKELNVKPSKVKFTSGAVTDSEMFPFEVDTQVDMLDEPPEGLNITTCITDSGNLEVITEGPAGTLETVLNYKDDGTIEVVTQITEIEPKGSTTTSYSSKKAGESSLSGPKSTSCHVIGPRSIKPCAANQHKDQQDRPKLDINLPLIIADKIPSSVCSFPKVAKSFTEMSKIASTASAVVQVVDSACLNQNLLVASCVNRCLSCSLLQANKTSSTVRVPQINATTSEATKKNSVTFETGVICTCDGVACREYGCTGTQQTMPVIVAQKSTGDDNTKATCSSLTGPVHTSSKCEDTYQGATELRSDEEISCSSDTCHRETCTDNPKTQDVSTNPRQYLKQDQSCGADDCGKDKSSKEASASETLESACQSNPQPLEQSCQSNETKNVGICTSGKSMTQDKITVDRSVCGRPPCITTCPVPCSPCQSSTKLDSVCQTVGDSVNSKVEEFHSARDISKEAHESGQEVPSSECPSECSDKPRKKRSGKLVNLECLCPGPCNCVICAPMNDNRQPPKDECDKKPHPKDCDCPECICERGTACQKEFAVYNLTGSHRNSENCSTTGSTLLDEAYIASMNLDCAANRAILGPLACAANRAIINVRDMFKKIPTSQASDRSRKSTPHSDDCECIDCLCMPVVRQLAMTREFPIIKDDKQIYQVSTTCQCPNTKKGSKIPVATRPGSGKPGGKGVTCNCTGTCTCSPCADPSKAKKPVKKEEVKTKRMTADQLAQLCDCGKCDCPICAKKRGKGKKACCCTPDCMCDACKIEMMKKQIDKLKTEVKELKGVSDPPDMGHPEGCDCGVCNCPLPAGDDPRRDQPDDCDCLVCDCPLAPGKGGDMSGCTCVDCDCPKSPRFQKPKVKKPIDLSGCTCNPCKCPGGPLSAFPKCDCKVCECDPCSDPRRPKKITCDCEPCECSPCGDPKRQAKKWHPKDCDCAECRCSGIKESECVCVTCVCDAHPPDCTCDMCVCGEEHPPGCTCLVCACGDKAVDHPPGCQCLKCICPGPPKPCPAGIEAEKKMKEFLKRNTSTHAIDCKCAACKCSAAAAGGALMCICKPCKCIECIFDRQTVAGHPPGCKCDECKCKECKISLGKGALACKCTDCKCKPCTHTGKQLKGKDCKCDVCNCNKCGDGDKKKDVKEAKSAPALPKNRSCHCICCYCDLCNNPAKKGSSARPDITIKGAGMKTRAAGPSSTSIKKPSQSGDHPQDCKCGACLCKECSFGAKHGPNCKCTDCVCKECGTGSPPQPPASKAAAASTLDCSCKPCACKECDKMSHPPGCKCDKCACKPCETQPPKKDVACHCSSCKCKECTDAGANKDPPSFETPTQKDCDCKQCNCVICSGKGGGKGGSSSGFEVPSRIPCQCAQCQCEVCNKGPTGGKKEPCSPKCPPPGGCGGGSSVGFQVPKRMACSCKQCNCVICNKVGGESLRGGSCGSLALRGGGSSSKEAPMFEIPSRMPCVCNPCMCIMCNKQAGKIEDSISARPSTNAAGVQYKCPNTVPSAISACDCPVCSCPSCASSIYKSKDDIDGPDCDCSLCRCAPCADPKVTISRLSAKVGDVLSTHSAKVGMSLEKHSRSTSCICTPLKNAKIGECENIFGASESIELNVLNLATMDNATLMKTIVDNTKENSHCKDQIQEITSALSNIKSACSEVEEKAMKTPLIKQASAFGQTMSGLKLALNNLQEKCKAKDVLIEAMTGELRNRTNSNMFLQVLDTCVSGDVPDYDKATDIIPKNYEEKKFKAMEGERIGRKKKGYKTCKCGKQHKDKDYKYVDLTGFEVVDIRRITHDSIIIKWKPPKTGPITGYDIFINGVNKSKVMSGGRTSAMVHSIDLSATIQITIYAVTKCGRCEPPAIAIYEIRT